MNAVPANAELLAIAAKYITDLLGSTPTTPKVKLAAAPFTPSATLDVSTLTEATFDGYAAKAVTSWGTVHLDASNQAVFISTSALDWTPSGSTTPNTIYGYWFLDSASNLVQSELLPTPVVLNGNQTTLQIVIELAIAAWKTNVTVLP